MTTSFLAGLVGALALPAAFGSTHFSSGGLLAWIGFVPLYLGILDRRPLQALRWGFFFGCGYFGLSLYWMVIALHHYGEVSLPVSALALGGAVLIESFFWAAAASAASFCIRRGAPSAAVFVCLMLLAEAARAHYPFGGFPWSQPAYTQHERLVLLQILDVTGVYGLLLLLLWSNTLIGDFLLRLRKARAFPKISLFSFLIVISAVLIYGHRRLDIVRRETQGADSLKVALIQGNVPQEEKWIEEKVDDIIDRHVALSLEAQKAESDLPDLIVWPEAAYPAVIPPEWEGIEILKSIKIPLLMGAVTYHGELPEEWPPDPKNPSFSLYNGAVLIGSDGSPGSLDAWYFKNHLVPMGEYVPGGSLFSFLQQVVPSWSSFTPGKGLHLLSVGEKSFGVTICYEDLFPEINRAFTRDGADFLVNLTNDAWYEKSSAVFQHVDFSKYRAIENRRSMVRATNTGVSALFSPTGEVLAQAPVFEETILTGEIPVVGLQTVYTLFGDWVVWLAAAGLLAALMSILVKGKKHEQGH